MEYLQLFIPFMVGMVVLSLASYFWRGYWRPAKRLLADIQDASRTINEISQHSSPYEYKKCIHDKLASTRFAHAWKMFSDTLHDQMDSEDGELKITQSRATTSSEFFFNQSAIVDTPIQSEFFKHLPGILTGIGIIGTFGGLLLGLSQFDPSGDPATVQKSLGLLLGGVRDAFIASGFAILVAMIVTAFEKHLLRSCYAGLEELTTALDSLFEAGVGEEYLEQLVASAHESATQAKQLKDSFVTDLKEMLTNLVEDNRRSQLEISDRLTTSYQESGKSTAEHISRAIEDSLKSPLEHIAASVSKVGNEQGNAVHTLLEDVLVNFTNKLESSFGSRIHEMLNATVMSMNEMQQGISSLISDMRNSSAASTSTIENQVVALLANMQTKQQELDLSMGRMLTQIEQTVGKIGDTGAAASQHMGAQMEGLLNGITGQIGTLLSSLEQKRLEQESAVTSSQTEMNLNMGRMLEHIEQTVGKIGDTGAAASQHMGTQMEGVLNGITNQIGTLLSSLEQKLLEQESAVTSSQTEMNRNMGRMLEHIEQTVGKIGDTGAAASQHMGAQMEGLLNGITGQIGTLLGSFEQKRLEQEVAVTTSQAEMNRNMGNMLDHIKQTVVNIGDTGAAASQKMGTQMENVLSNITVKVTEMLNNIESGRREHEAASSITQQALHDKTNQLIKSLEQQISNLMGETQKALSSSRQQLESLNALSTKSIQGMHEGADKMRMASEVFTVASSGLTNVTERNTTLFNEVNKLTTNLIRSSDQLKQLLSDNQKTQQAVDIAISTLRELVQSTHYETDMHGQIIADMKAMTTALSHVREETRGYLNEISDVLGKSFNDFSGSVERSLVKVLGTFDNTLDQAVQHLASGVKELGEVVEELAEITPRNKR